MTHIKTIGQHYHIVENKEDQQFIVYHDNLAIDFYPTLKEAEAFILNEVLA